MRTMQRVHCQNSILASVLTILLWLSVIAGGSMRRIFPVTLEIREGEDMQIRLTKALENETSCYVRTPNLIDCNLKAGSDENSECNEKISYWSVNGECGIRVRNVNREDEGFWRLTAKDETGNKKVIDAAKINILDKFKTDTENVSLLTGLGYSLTFNDVENHCMVYRPYSKQQIFVKDSCYVFMRSVTKADDGNWTAVVGVKGQVEETEKTTKINVFSEYVDSGYNVSSDSNSVNLFCNLKADKNALSICRFTRTTSTQKGLRLKEGLRKGRYGYYGNGLENGECGLSIDSPDENDYGSWYCFLQQDKKPPLGATIFLPRNFSNAATFSNKGPGEINSHAKVWATSLVLTSVSNPFDVKCSSNVALSYCWFTLPNGEPLAVWQQESESKDIKVSSSYKLAVGECQVSITKAAKEHNGTWTCHMGPEKPGIELSQNVTVRVGDTPLTATKQFVSNDGGDTITLECKTAPQPTALQYCRFYLPSGIGLNINGDITREKPIRHDDVSYWFSGKDISTGDCGLVVKNVKPEHTGKWMCAGKLEGQTTDNEAFDTIHVVYQKVTTAQTDEAKDMTAAAMGGIIVAVIIVIAVIGFSVFKTRNKLRAWVQRRRARQGNARDSYGVPAVSLDDTSSNHSDENRC